jgi:hypothetical protein
LRAVMSERLDDVLGVEVALQHHRVAEQDAHERVAETPRMKRRRRDHHRLAGPIRNSFEQRNADGGIRRPRRHRSFRCAGCARREDDRARFGGRPREPFAVLIRLDQRVDLGVAVRAERNDAIGDAGLVRDGAVFLVVHEQRGPLARHHVAQLRAGEARVEEHRVHAELGDCAGGVEEVTVVAAQDRDRVAGMDAPSLERPGERVGALVELGEGERSPFVDERDAVAVARRTDRKCGRQIGAPVPNRGRHAQDAVGPVDVQYPGACEHADAVGCARQPFEGSHRAMLRVARRQRSDRRGAERGVDPNEIAANCSL